MTAVSHYYQGLIKEERACNSKRAEFKRGRIWMECACMIVHEMLKIELSIFSTHANSHIHPPIELC